MTAKLTRPHLKSGQPTKYREEYCQQIVDFCGQGFSIAAFAGSINCSRGVIFQWEQDHPEFFEAVHRAKAKSLLKWEQRAGKISDEGGTGGQAAITMFAMKNFGPDDWRDRHEINVSGTVNIDALLTLADERAQPKLAGESAKVIEHDAANSTESAAADQHLVSQPDTT